MSDQQFKLVQQTAAHNLAAWKDSGVVKTLKYYSARMPTCARRAEHTTAPYSTFQTVRSP